MTELGKNEVYQSEYWNGPGGRNWVDGQQALDAMYAPLERLLVDEVRKAGGRRVLDVGCGTGATTLAVARALPSGGRATGIDLSEPMVATARQRAATERSPATFICADVQTHPFAPADFDTVISRFGVMFFPDPVAAFANLRTALAPGAVLRLLVWRAPEENPFMTTVERAAAPFLTLPERHRDGPGPFGLCDPARTRDILARAGFSDVDIQPVDFPLTLPETDLSGYITRLGPVGIALAKVDEAKRAEILAAVRAAFERFVEGEVVSYTAACWMVGGRNGARAF